ncbi:hypothetical protein [Evansella clarkii]|uniref:hypothetical protein n=1 Tax=Evansella clarkii TaxID=79879 RepID=UPI000B447DF1|nr:hypothetical protein [Evansella clarkii]
MKTKPLKDFSNKKVRTVISSMQTYRDTLTQPERDLFDLDFAKVVRFKKEAELDGMGMRQISLALKRTSIMLFKKFGASEMKERRQLLINIAHEVDIKRIIFQRDNGPKVNKKKELTA